MVNGQPISEQQLQAGDIVGIGTVTLKVIEARTIGSTGSLPHSEMNETRGIGERRTVHRTGLEGRFPGDGVDISALLRRLASGKPASLALKDAAGNRSKLHVRRRVLLQTP